MTPAALALVASAWHLYSRRKFHGIYLRLANCSDSHLRTAGIFSLTPRLERHRLLGWLVGVVVTAVLTGSIAGSFVTLTKKNAGYSDLPSKISGGGETASRTASIFSVIAGIVTVCESANAVSSLVETEKKGVLDIELASGASKSRVAMAHAVAGAVGSTTLTAADAVTLAIAVGLSLD